SARGEAGGAAHSAADEIRDGREPQDRQGARPYGTPIDSAARRRGDRMRRRDFITVVSSAALASPIVARAQQAMPVIGFLGVETPDVFAGRVRAFRQGLGEMGYVEGRNVAIVFQWAGGNYDLLPTLADELVRQRVSVLVAAGTAQAARAAKAATA